PAGGPSPRRRAFPGPRRPGSRFRSLLLHFTDVGQQVPPGIPAGLDVPAGLAAGLAAGFDLFPVFESHVSLLQPASFPPETAVIRTVKLSSGAAAVGAAAADPLRQDDPWQRCLLFM